MGNGFTYRKIIRIVLIGFAVAVTVIVAAVLVVITVKTNPTVTNNLNKANVIFSQSMEEQPVSPQEAQLEKHSSCSKWLLEERIRWEQDILNNLETDKALHTDPDETNPYDANPDEGFSDCIEEDLRQVNDWWIQKHMFNSAEYLRKHILRSEEFLEYLIGKEWK